uniref:anthocyanidin 3-O-glucosyltransferase n=1 Tax=Linum usitatissimum TaxID=4006 RepID=I2BHE5_LINUS|nr:UDP-glycosyltransferase 1 [Linum usitatissimum]AGD95006.1 UDP-glucosyltransferase [Linum usitatissimum]
MPALKEAFDDSRPEFCKILKRLKPDLLVYDVLQPWAAEAAAESNVVGIKCVLFVPGGAACYSFLAHYSIKPAGAQYPLQDWGIASREGFLKKRATYPNGLRDEDLDTYTDCMKRSSDIILIKTSRNIEAKYIDYLSELLGKEVVPVGPLVNDKPEDHRTGAEGDDDNKILKWLNSIDSDSPVVYVSFGSEYFPSKEEMGEIARGLEMNQALIRFIWVVRFPPDDHHREKNNKTLLLQEALPEGFLERVEGRGLLVEGWAPQAEILRNERVGGFVSHCGWSSVIEAVVYGVPIVAMPMQLDQPWNANLVEEIGVGVEVKGNKDGMIKRIDGDEMGRVIGEVLGDMEMRNRVRELSEKLKGDADAEMDCVVDRLRSLVEGV